MLRDRTFLMPRHPAFRCLPRPCGAMKLLPHFSHWRFKERILFNAVVLPTLHFVLLPLLTLLLLLLLPLLRPLRSSSFSDALGSVDESVITCSPFTCPSLSLNPKRIANIPCDFAARTISFCLHPKSGRCGYVSYLLVFSLNKVNSTLLITTEGVEGIEEEIAEEVEEVWSLAL